MSHKPPTAGDDKPEEPRRSTGGRQGPPTPEAFAGFEAAMLEVLRRRHPERTWRAFWPDEGPERDAPASAGQSTTEGNV
jgi:hypothetical protein